MLDQGNTLATWQLARDPACLQAADSQESVPARRIGDHRRAYLTYEGPVSGNRGTVSRVAQGQYELMEQTEAEWIVELRSGDLTGRFRISPLRPDQEGSFQRCR